jgi:energy-coupling factor transport system ATP-binding protein
VLFRDTVREEIATTLDWNDSSADPESVVAAFGLALSILGAHPRDLSAGQRQLVAIASVAATGAPVLLLDEPSRGLDPESKLRLVSFLRGYVAGGRAVMLATHDVELAALIAGRVIMLAGGEVVAEGSPADVLGDSPVFAPQTARVFGPEWLTPEQVAAAVAP